MVDGRKKDKRKREKEVKANTGKRVTVDTGTREGEKRQKTTTKRIT